MDQQMGFLRRRTLSDSTSRPADAAVDGASGPLHPEPDRRSRQDAEDMSPEVENDRVKV
jgi:hypothetical protein